MSEPRASFDDLLAVMARLRGPGGCPWDRAQTPQTLRPYLLEEAYEVLDAIDRDDPRALCEELGDVLLQIVFHAQMAVEAGRFSAPDVVHGLVRKLIDRHPHVFADMALASPEAVKAHWDRVKHAERPGTFEGIPETMPALTRAQKVQERARALGFQWPDAGAAVRKVRDELDEFVAAETPTATAEELGDLFFTLINVAIFHGIDAEQAVRDTTRKFIERFERMQRLAEASSTSLTERPVDELLALWREAKDAGG